MTDTLTITRPDDWHLHFRDGDLLEETVPQTSRCFGRAIVMPNLVPPVTDAKTALAYRDRIMQAHNQSDAAKTSFEPLMTLYLTSDTTPDTIREAKAAGVKAVKLYPAGATTNSDKGVSRIQQLAPVLEALSEVGMLLLIHGEVTDADIDIFDREKIFIDRHLIPIVENHSQLKIVLEHITTKDAAEFVLEAGDNLGATITPQHLLMNRNDLLVGGVHVHNYCLPVLKRNTHQQALQEVALSGSPKFFLGTDSAPHARHKKEAACGCAGCYSSPAAIELYAEFFEQMGAIDKLEAFASFHGPDFYGLPRHSEKITLTRQDWKIPDSLPLADGTTIVPFSAGRTLTWKYDNKVFVSSKD